MLADEKRKTDIPALGERLRWCPPKRIYCAIDDVLCGLCGTLSWVTGPGRIRSAGGHKFLIKFGEMDNRRSRRFEQRLPRKAREDGRATEWHKMLRPCLWRMGLAKINWDGSGEFKFRHLALFDFLIKLIAGPRAAASPLAVRAQQSPLPVHPGFLYQTPFLLPRKITRSTTLLSAFLKGLAREEPVRGTSMKPQCSDRIPLGGGPK